MNKICTDVSQSKKLLELGIDINTADFHWFNNILMLSFDKVAKAHYDKTEYEYIPAWSLAALLGVIPNYKLSSEHNYHTCTAETSFGKETVAWLDNPVDAVFEMVCWLKENNRL